jgi:hypothetical protein
VLFYFDLAAAAASSSSSTRFFVPYFNLPFVIFKIGCFLPTAFAFA